MTNCFKALKIKSMIRLKVSFLILFSAFLAGCGNDCSQQVSEITNITNLTGFNVKIELCKVPYKQESGSTKEKVNTRSLIVEYDIAANQDGEYLADQYESSYKKEKGQNCTIGDDPKYSSQVFLTAASVNQVKLCRDNVDPTKATLVRLSAACPVGATSQLQAVASCDETALVN